jgi:hypothetical protein
MRTDFDGSADIEADPSLFRLPDGRLYLTPPDSTYYNRQYVYSPQTDRFVRTYGLTPARPGEFSASASGRFMLGNRVFVPELYTWAVVAAPDWRRPGAALTPDGNSVFLATEYGYAKFGVVTGQFPNEQVKLGTQPMSLLLVPDGSLLIAVGVLPGTNMGEYAVMFIDLR